ncbi:MAG: GNAT family N-acetyltransferase [Bacteroidota bacterium]
MKISVEKTALKTILPLRQLFLQENNIQIRYNACHERGWTHSYLIKLNNQKIGYGSVKGREDYLNDRDAIFEFYIIPSFRKYSNLFFAELIKISQAKYLECQSNQNLLPDLLFEFSKNIYADTILFADDGAGFKLELTPGLPDVVFRKRKPGEIITGKKEGDMGAYILESKKEIMATGDFLTHYNFPFADLFMEVKKEFRGKGLGGYILQEIKKECYLAGRVPAARCNINNHASKATLLKAGFKVCGYMLVGELSL